MKAITAVCATTTAPNAQTILSGRITRPHRDGENAEIQMYLSKLKDLVPYMPKNKKLSKLEVIQNVIDYICDLQTALESNTPGGSAAVAAAFDASAVLNSGGIDAEGLCASAAQASVATRQPLGVRASPNHRIQRRRPSTSQQNHSTANSTSNNTSSNNNCDLILHLHHQQHTVSFVRRA